MPQPCKEALKKTLCAELEAVLAKRPDLLVVKIADGTHDNWRYLDALAPQGTSVVDFYLKFRDSLTEMDSRFRGNDGQTATASVKVTCLAEMTSFPRKRESIA